MKIQYLSDLHIEHFRNFDDFDSQYKNKFGRNIFETVHGQVLVLAGDIGNPFRDSYRDFLKLCSLKYQAVIIVLGNHECYGNEYWSVVEQARSVVADIENVHFLEQDSVELDIDGSRVAFVGCLLWSHVPLKAQPFVESCMNDYEMISIKEENVNRKLLVQDTSKIYEQSVKWLSAELEKHQGKKVVVVTHHAPLVKGVSSPYFETDDLDECTKLCNHAFASDLSYLCKDPVVLWIFGHTHYSSNQKFNGIPITSNQLGYISPSLDGSDSDNVYREELVLEL